jgi:hypothetical protein
MARLIFKPRGTRPQIDVYSDENRSVGVALGGDGRSRTGPAQ